MRASSLLSGFTAATISSKADFYVCVRCARHVRVLSTTLPARKRMRPQVIDGTTEFGRAGADLLRVKRRADFKRRQGGRTFLDHLILDVQAGKGGDGSVAFFRDVHTPHGPPSGGNGGPGGDVYVQAVRGLTSLGGVGSRIRGAQGGHGMGRWRHGRKGADVLIPVPVGTVVREVGRPKRKDQEEDEEEDIERGREMTEAEKEERQQRERHRLWVHYPMSEEANLENRLFLQAEAALKREMRHEARMNLSGREQGEPLYLDLDEPGEPVLVAHGGRGGVGNPFFASTDNRSPKWATRGRGGERVTLELELKLLADVGLVGLPNAGKSTLLRALTNAKAEVAGYAFTTLNPQIGTVRLWADGGFGDGDAAAIEHTEDERELRELGLLESESKKDWTRDEAGRLTVCDNPGLLARASEDVGLGHEFLRSVERARALVYVLDLSAPTPWADLAVLKGELEAYRAGLSSRARLVVANKADLLGNSEDGGDKAEQEAWVKVRRLEAEAQGMDVVPVSAKFRMGLERVVQLLRSYVADAR